MALTKKMIKINGKDHLMNRAVIRKSDGLIAMVAEISVLSDANLLSNVARIGDFKPSDFEIVHIGASNYNLTKKKSAGKANFYNKTTDKTVKKNKPTS